MGEHAYITAWREATNCAEAPENYSKSTIEGPVIELFGSFEGIKKTGNGPRNAFRQLWKMRASPYAIAYCIGGAIANDARGYAYVESILPNAPDAPEGLEVPPVPEVPEVLGGDKQKDETAPAPASGEPNSGAALTPEQAQPNHERDGRQGKNFVFLYRAIRRHPYFRNKNPLIRLFFIDLILDASYGDHEIEWRGIKIKLKRGQWVISIRSSCLEYRVVDTTLLRWLKDLQINNMVSFDPISMKSDFIVAPPAAPHAAPPAARHDKVGVLVTILNYNKWQMIADLKSDFIVAPHAAPHAAPPAALHKNGLQKNGFTETPLTPQGDQAPLTSVRLFDIWDRECSPLSKVSVRVEKSVAVLLRHLNIQTDNGKGPEERWIEIIHQARDSIPEHYPKMSPTFFSKDLEHINQIERGIYKHSFKKGEENGESRINVTRGSRKGDPSVFAGKSFHKDSKF